VRVEGRVMWDTMRVKLSDIDLGVDYLLLILEIQLGFLADFERLR